ncbi:zinc metalloprotease HtpX [Microgenomates group bacterium RBG_16_45_19]|nr:MAG: zinc metalloprotease HtpX [Microgenomates group bacterium RBG_16_45_19]
MLNIYEQVDTNKRKSLLIMISFVGFIVAVSYLLAYSLNYPLSFVALALVLSVLASLSSFYYSDRLILGLSRAQPANRDQHFHFYTAAENLSLAAGLPVPKLYVINDTALNAFATGRDPQHAVVCVTTGLLHQLDRTELEGVIAHELAHIKNFDTRLMTLVTVLVGVVALLADLLLRGTLLGGRRRQDKSGLDAILLLIGLVLALLSPLIATLIKLAISRRREFLADATGAAITKYPEGLARALEKIAADPEPLEVANKATAHLYIANPLKNHHDAVSFFSSLFATHPPINQRIAALRS